MAELLGRCVFIAINENVLGAAPLRLISHFSSLVHGA